MNWCAAFKSDRMSTKEDLDLHNPYCLLRKKKMIFSSFKTCRSITDFQESPEGVHKD